MNIQLARGILSVVFGIAGFVLIGVHANGWIALGVFLCFFGHNLEQHSGRK